MTAQRDTEFTGYVQARLPWLRRIAYLLCQDWDRADDLVQGAVTRLYLHWGKASSAGQTDAYVRTILVREFLTERRSGWARRVTLAPQPPDSPRLTQDHDAALDLRAALSALPPRQRATLVLRFYCDLSIAQAAEVLGCSPGTVKSQTAKSLGALRRLLEPDTAAGPNGRSSAPLGRRQAHIAEGPDHG